MTTTAPTSVACVFDAYGTLLDVNAAARAVSGELGDLWEDFSILWRQKQLEYSWLRTLMDRHADFWSVTGAALDHADKALGMDITPDLRARLMALYMTLEAYGEVAGVLDALKAKGLPLVILSNGTPRMLDSATRHAGIRDLFDAILSVEEVAAYKPHPSVYQLAQDRLLIPRERILFLSSNGWDIAGAASFGFTTAWINRFNRPRENLSHGPAHELRDLTSVPELVEHLRR
ncbi:MAG: haloacid dehalogenase type II [Rhodospirillum sp.]|nr:haloacid dehalogenase type II [Rhodospirillum sp.]MCF8491332.1 haloacid dehalogenase type II [Rhodospirillum sp.]MCF8503146.1 haloacid dehalogenase type II [Rhodospirillum sp.]